MTNPADGERLVAEVAASMKAARARIDRWNEQIVAGVATIRTAAERGHGVIVSVSVENDTVEVVEDATVSPGKAYVFDRDAGIARPVVARLAESLFTDEPIPTIWSGIDSTRAYRIPFDPIVRVTP